MYTDPLAALDTEFVAERTYNPANKWSSILYHYGSPRVLCAKIFRGDPPPQICEIEFFLKNADNNGDLGPLKAEECKDISTFSVEARPSATCAAIRSARMSLDGPINSVRTENFIPYTVFGDFRGIVNGRDFLGGQYTISADFYSECNLGGAFVASASFVFTVVDCDRRLRGDN